MTEEEAGLTTLEPAHNHVTRDIRPFGECPACDRYWTGAPR